MKICFLRHGIAMDKEDWAPRDDSKRPLTKEGKQKLRHIAKGLRRLNLKFDRILTSPYDRALKTAQIAAEILDADKKLDILPSLASDGDAREVMELLAKQQKVWQTVLLVGHDPYLSHLISQLTTGAENAGIHLKKGGVVLLTAEHPRYDACAKLEWLIPPKIFEKLH